MSENINNPTPESTASRRTQNTHMSVEEFIAYEHQQDLIKKQRLIDLERQRSAAQALLDAQQRQQQRSAQLSGRQTVGEVAAAPRKPMSKRTRKALVATTSMLTVGVLAGGAYYSSDGLQQIIDNWTHNSTDANTAIQPVEKLATTSLTQGQCELPDAVLMVATVDAYMPLVPLVATSANSIPVKVPPYMTESNMRALPNDKQALFESHITKDKYQHATLNEIPLMLTVCQPTGVAAITEEDGIITLIDRSSLQVSFEDPDGMFDTGINAVKQVTKADNLNLDPAEGQYMTQPEQIFLGTSPDAATDDSITKLKKAMKTELQSQIILGLMEEKVVAYINNAVNPPKNVTYTDSNAKSFTDALDAALIQRLVGSSGKSPKFTGSYDVTMNVPSKPANKLLSITDPDPKTGESPLIGLDPNQDIVVSKIIIQNGSMSPPKPPTPSPSPTPTESNAP
jgi:hypothetical protein